MATAVLPLGRIQINTGVDHADDHAMPTGAEIPAEDICGDVMWCVAPSAGESGRGTSTRCRSVRRARAAGQNLETAGATAERLRAHAIDRAVGIKLRWRE